jgi:aminoglycoside N3'-acetyltransferase
MTEPLVVSSPEALQVRQSIHAGGEATMPDHLRREMSRTEVAQQLRGLGVEEGGVLLVHTSYRAVRPVEAGPSGLIDALLLAISPSGTLVMPCWSGDDDTPFIRDATPASPDLGVVAETFRRLGGVERSDHFHAFAAYGPEARRILADPLPCPPHVPESPVGQVHELDGQVLLIGVGHDANTTLHLAEIVGGAPYGVPRHCTIVENGSRRRVDYLENDHCCARFAVADDWLREAGLQAEGRVGHAHARLFRSRDLVSAAVAALREDPLLFLHSPEAGCADCDEARASVR